MHITLVLDELKLGGSISQATVDALRRIAADSDGGETITFALHPVAANPSDTAEVKLPVATLISWLNSIDAKGGPAADDFPKQLEQFEEERRDEHKTRGFCV